MGSINGWNSTPLNYDVDSHPSKPSNLVDYIGENEFDENNLNSLFIEKIRPYWANIESNIPFRRNVESNTGGNIVIHQKTF